VFLADSTGDMGIALDLFEALAEPPPTFRSRSTRRTRPCSMRVRSTATSGVGTAANADAWSAYRTAEAETAIDRAPSTPAQSDAQVHIAHTSTPEGIDAVSDTDATCEVTPHHLFLSREDAGRLGTFGRMNPPLRSEERRAAVFERLRDGDVDVVATDHAPHTVAEKRQRLVDAPSGVPGVETLYPLLLESVRKGNLSLERVRDVVAANPASIFEIGERADRTRRDDASSSWSI